MNNGSSPPEIYNTDKIVVSSFNNMQIVIRENICSLSLSNRVSAVRIKIVKQGELIDFSLKVSIQN